MFLYSTDLRSGCCCRHSWTRLCRVAEWFLGPGLWGRSVGGAVALCVRLPVATLSPMPESTPDRDTFSPPSSPRGKGATSRRQQWEPRSFCSSIWKKRWRFRERYRTAFFFYLNRGFHYLSGWHVLERHPAADKLASHDAQTVDIRLHSVTVQVLLRATSWESKGNRSELG